VSIQIFLFLLKSTVWREIKQSDSKERFRAFDFYFVMATRESQM